MTKKDYEAIAESIEQTTLIMNDTLVNKAQLIDHLVTYFQTDNPNFSRGKFIEACYKREVSDEV